MYKLLQQTPTDANSLGWVGAMLDNPKVRVWMCAADAFGETDGL